MIFARTVGGLNRAFMVINLWSSVKVFVAHRARIEAERLLVSLLLVVITILMRLLHHNNFVLFNHLPEELPEDFLRAYVESLVSILVQRYEFNAVIFWHNVLLYELVLRAAI